MSETFEDQHRLETYKSLISLSTEGFRFSAFANGGAAVAMLAYLGNVAGGKCLHTPDMRVPMGAFLAGLLMCGIVMVLAYFTQLRLFQDTRNDQGHRWLLWPAAALFILTLVAFALGAFTAVTKLG
jgi:hypothetical protein